MGVDLEAIGPYVVTGPDNKAFVVSGRALDSESRLHLTEHKARLRKAARRLLETARAAAGAGGSSS